jgi:hypothetical protein
MRFGQLKDGSWALKAMTPAVWKTVSESPTRRGITRFYCQTCADEVQNWPDGSTYLLKDQLMDALKYVKGTGIDVELPR